jgi:hypothetical protein
MKDNSLIGKSTRYVNVFSLWCQQAAACCLAGLACLLGGLRPLSNECLR